MATGGTAPCECGVVFELSPTTQGGSWSQTLLWVFDGGSDGGYVPSGPLVFDKVGNLYGATAGGGFFGGGTVFELMPPGSQGGNWTEVVLYSFPLVTMPNGGLIFDPSGNIFGTSTAGGGSKRCPNGCGTAFELTPTSGGAWTETVLYSFGVAHSELPYAGLVLDKAGNLWGTTDGETCGSVFRLQQQPSGWTEAEYDFFANSGQPCGPHDALIFGKGGALYGTSYEGGTSKVCSQFACGTVFSFQP
jgi:hypothetical protein